MPPLTLTAMRFAIAVSRLLIFTEGRPAWPRAAWLGALGIGIG
ncbi:uncharacterized protein BRPE67_CCDS07530 [Caballeronia cordobensis]|nr:uncharacterized protein BRPE67_CCDS07530 [Burkholderia sp. RPE67]